MKPMLDNAKILSVQRKLNLQPSDSTLQCSSFDLKKTLGWATPNTFLIFYVTSILVIATIINAGKVL